MTDHSTASSEEAIHAAAGKAHRPGDVPDEPHGPQDHGDDHGHDDHAHGSDSLGTVDVQAWGALALGIGLGLIVAFCVAVSTGAI